MFQHPPNNNKKNRHEWYLHCDESVIHHHLFRQEISSYCCFILITKLLIHILIHQGGLPNSFKTQRKTSLVELQKLCHTFFLD